MRRPTRALQTEWAAKLEAAGFDDLESKSGLLSNRGRQTLGRAPGERGWRDDGADSMRLQSPLSLAEHETYAENAREIARTHRFATKLDRRIWTLWAEGVETTTGRQREEIARQVGVSTRQVRQSLWRTRAAVEREAREGMNPINPSRVSAREKVDRLVRQADPQFLVAFALGLG